LLVSSFGHSREAVYNHSSIAHEVKDQHKEMKMAGGKLTVMALLRAKPGNEEAVKQGLLALLEPTRNEPGCINYDLHQSVGAPGLFMFYENWKSKTDLDGHLKTPHMQDFMRKGREILAGPPEVTLWEMSDPAE
jgi:quinol monooxygenase YgiN